MAKGKTITLFLMDGDANGRMACELSNWTGKAYKLPHSALKECDARPELKQPGVYFLFGRNDVEVETPIVYIGEAENIYKRLCEHDGEDYWNEVITFISKDRNLNKAHVKYLENSFYTLARTAGRCQLKNSSVPTRPALSESDESDLEEFIEKALVLVNTLGYNVFEKTITEAEAEELNKQLTITRGNVKARGIQTAKGFLVYKGASMNTECKYEPAKKVREKFKSKYEDGATVEDIEFSSSSTAAMFLLGYSVNGRDIWKNVEGKSISELEQKK